MAAITIGGDFGRIQVSQKAGKVGWDSHLFNNSQFIVIHAVKAFSIDNEAEVDVFLELSEVPEQASDPSPGESKGGGVAGQTISPGQSPRLSLHKTEVVTQDLRQQKEWHPS